MIDYSPHTKYTAQKIQDKVREIDSFVKEIMRSSTQDILNIEVKQEEFYVLDLLNKMKNAYLEQCKLKKMDFF